jgi:hypothetical protein
MGRKKSRLENSPVTCATPLRASAVTQHARLIAVTVDLKALDRILTQRAVP